MLRKNTDIKWTDEARKSFSKIKLALTESLVLINLEYSMEVLAFSFFSEDTVASVLLQNNVQGFKQPISLFSKELRDA
jgi:hypothetical protein